MASNSVQILTLQALVSHCNFRLTKPLTVHKMGRKPPLDPDAGILHRACVELGVHLRMDLLPSQCYSQPVWRFILCSCLVAHSALGHFFQTFNLEQAFFFLLIMYADKQFERELQLGRASNYTLFGSLGQASFCCGLLKRACVADGKAGVRLPANVAMWHLAHS